MLQGITYKYQHPRHKHIFLIMYPFSVGFLAITSQQKYRDQILICYNSWCKDLEKHNIPYFFYCGSDKTPASNPTNPELEEHITHLDVPDDYKHVVMKVVLGVIHRMDNYESEFYLCMVTDSIMFVGNIVEYLQKNTEIKTSVNIS